MQEISPYLIIIVLSSLVILSYIYSIISEKWRIPSVLLLLGTGMALNALGSQFGWQLELPSGAIELVGVIGLIMIVLEAGLDLKFSKNKINLITNAFYSSIFVLILSAAGISYLLHILLGQPWINSIVYAVPLSVISSAIVLPSIRGLTELKREFLAYEASFSDILGILAFDYVIMKDTLALQTLLDLGGGILFAITMSFFVSLLLLWVLTRTKISIKFFLVFAALLMLYSFGHVLHLPALLIILVFGLVINNWEKIRDQRAKKFVPKADITEVREVLKSITAETSFLIRTFFFVLFGYTIETSGLFNESVLIVGSIIVILLYLVRYLFLNIFLHRHVLPELFYAPRGLVTILLFYQIPQSLQLNEFNDGILFFVIIATSIIMMIGSLFFTPKEAREEA